jgi:hypothetical protein
VVSKRSAARRRLVRIPMLIIGILLILISMLRRLVVVVNGGKIVAPTAFQQTLTVLPIHRVPCSQNDHGDHWHILW